MNKKQKVVIIIQARTGSTRLPAKILMPILGKSVLLRQVERIRRSHEVHEIVVATTHETSDDLIVQQCRAEGISVFRGSTHDCLDRHYQCGCEFDADIIVKIPSDCPLIDPSIIDRLIRFYCAHSDTYDYVSNLHPPTYPDGNDVEVFPMSILRTAWNEATKSYEREHTTPFIWDNPDRFFCATVRWESGLDYSMSHRWTLDYEADYHFILSVYKELYTKNPCFGINDILMLLQERPDIAQLNASLAGVNWYRHHLSDLKTVDQHMTRTFVG